MFHLSKFVEQCKGAGLDLKFGSDYLSNPREFAEKAAQAIPADVRMISGCQDAQTSADVQNIAVFGLPPDAGPGGAGGACTNAFLSAIHADPNPTWIDLLKAMRGILAQKGFKQVPELSSSRQTDLQGRFEIESEGGGRKRALIIGINYVGQQGELRGCVNDAKAMKHFLASRGFTEFRMLTDGDVSDGQPTAQNILEGFRWLSTGAKQGDSLFFHYSGHGGSVRDTNGDEKDGKDETIVPVDYRTAGQIIDDVILKELVLPLPAGCQLTSVMDCCHSGTVFDLPYLFTANDQNVAQAEGAINAGGIAALPINGDFNLVQMLKLAAQLCNAITDFTSKHHFKGLF
eukprot:EG_transcript_15081